MPSYLKTMSLVYHAFRNMQILEYKLGVPIMCSDNSQFRSCANSTSDNPMPIDVEELLNREKDGFYIPYYCHTIFLLGFFVLFRCLGYFALRKSLWLCNDRKIYMKTTLNLAIPIHTIYFMIPPVIMYWSWSSVLPD